MSDVVISYARSTTAQAHAVAEALRSLGYDVWRDDQLPAHRSYTEVIEEQLESARAVVVVWSAEAARSQWVQSEADRARHAGKLVQLRLDDVRLPMPFDRVQCADMTDWTGDLAAPGWRTVVETVAELIGGPGSRSSQSAHAAAPLRRHSVCVLPFANMSGDPEQEYFSDGISEDIITDLSKVSALFVVARNTAFQFKGKAVDVPQVARQLNVSHVLEGSVRKAGARVRITAQLIDGATGGHVWAERYDRDLSDIFALQDEISQAIVGVLKLKLLPEEKQAIERHGTENVEAYSLYLMARQQLLSGNIGDVRREEAMIRLCSRAVEIDPAYAPAWSLMAHAQSSLRFNRGKAGDDGLAAAERALQFDPTLAEPHAVKAKILADRGKHDEAFAELAQALRLDADSLEVTTTAATLYFHDKHFVAAESYYAKAVELDDTSIWVAGMLITTRIALGDREGAQRAAETTLARAEKVVAQDQNNGNAMAFGALALGVLGQGERAREWINRAILVDPENMPMRYNFACALATHLNDFDRAIELLVPVLGTATVSLLGHAKVDPDLDPLRADPRFVALLAAAETRLAGGIAGGSP